jgi:hypothetical protein
MGIRSLRKAKLREYQKATRWSGSPALRLRYAPGQPAVLTENGVELELAFGSDNRSP